MRLSQLIRILWVHRAMSMWIVVSVLALAAAASFLLPKKYTAESAVVVDARGIDPLAQNSVMQAQQEANYVTTQVDVIESHNVALKVVDRLKLTTDPQIIEKFQSKTGGVGSIRDFAADEILKPLTVKVTRDSDVIFIYFTSKSAQAAADMANAFSEAYLQASLELKVDPAHRQAGWFDQQVNDLRTALETAQRKLSSLSGSTWRYWNRRDQQAGRGDGPADRDFQPLRRCASHHVRCRDPAAADA